jgi:hypothetical protein
LAKIARDSAGKIPICQGEDWRGLCPSRMIADVPPEQERLM